MAAKTDQYLAVVFPLIACALLGCHKKEPAPAGAGQNLAPGSVAAQPAKPLPPPPLFISVRADNYVRENVAGEADAFLTRQLHAFIQKKGRLPTSFAEFVNLGLDDVPNPPAGKKWTIDSADVQVKAVANK